MSEPRGQGEPSMEEILASIRRIISEDSQTPPANGAAGRAAEAGTPMALDDAESDVLLLTEMIADDGSVVSLAAARERLDQAAARPATVTPHPGGPAGALRADLEWHPDIDNSLPPAEPAQPPTPIAAATHDTVELPTLAMHSDQPKVPLVTAPTATSADATTRGERLQQTPNDMEAETVSTEIEKPLGLVSEHTATAATAAFGEVARAVARDREPSPTVSGRMIDDLVREALQPMLKQWLDGNLTPIVERVVRQEIQKMVRRAEEDT